MNESLYKKIADFQRAMSSQHKSKKRLLFGGYNGKENAVASAVNLLNILDIKSADEIVWISVGEFIKNRLKGHD